MSLANLFALGTTQPERLAAVEADLDGSAEFARVWRPAAGWVAAVAPLPGAEREEPLLDGLAFAEHPPSDSTGAWNLEPATLDEWLDRSPERLASLPGDFGFVRFLPNASAFVVRSCGGLVPFYLFEGSGYVAVSTRLGDLARFAPDEPRLDPLVNAAWTAGSLVFPDDRTFLAGVSILGRGHWTRIEGAKRQRSGRYWTPWKRRLGRPRPREHAEELRRLLVEKLSRDLDPAGGNLLTWSGGVDSSALGALAAGALGRPLSTVSLVPPPSHPRFEHEMSFMRPLASHCGFAPSYLIYADLDTRMRLLDAAPRAVFHVAHPPHSALATIRRETPVGVIVGGEFADEVCGSYHTTPDWAAHTSLLAILTGRARLPFGPEDLGRWAKHRWLGAVRRPFMDTPETLGNGIHPQLREEYQEWWWRRRRAAGRMRCANRFLHLRSELIDTFVVGHWEVESTLGIRRSLPFFTREVLELAGECHPSELLGNGNKSLLRAALANDVPRRNLERQDKGAWARWGSEMRDARLSWSGPLPEMLAPVLTEGWFPRPPEVMSSFELASLKRTVIFVESLEKRRRGEAAEPATLPMHRLDGSAVGNGRA
jgi:asparagine synthetase B (glutamine-hydrolysing)